MEKTYDPKLIEDKWYAAWERGGLFHSDADRGGEPYAVMIPPPNVTGILHIGHALNNALQDILVRWRRMQGRNAIWVPGTDHAGIATQNVVERALREEGRTREHLGREAFVERVWSWREEYGGTIIRQLKRLGASCDWERERFTMDEGLSRAVTEVFVRLYEKGLVYRANYIINWCPRCQTALSDEESEHREQGGKLWYIRYPAQDPGATGVWTPGADAVVVATTRPETMLGDVAVAVNPDDARYARWAGKTVVLPIVGRELKVIHDAFVDPAFGTGAVKVTPAHDPNDFAMGQRHGLQPVNVMHGDGTMNEQAGAYAGLDRFECRRRLVEDLGARGFLERVEEHVNAVGHCYRCDTAVEPRLSPQWFVKMKPLAAPAIEAVRNGTIQFLPARWKNVYLDWMENIRDWCISRQIWWGHRIPVFACEGCGHTWAARETPVNCPACAGTVVRQDEDVLDTWFSSWLWPFSTLGWPDRTEDLAFYYPTHDLVTASEIIFFWVARMIMAGLEFMGAPPFSRVYIHGTVRDERGRKMSKSLGNSIDPLTVIEKYSADALRFSLMMITATGQDVFLSDEKFQIGRNFGTKLWNAARFMRLHEETRTPSGAPPAVPLLDGLDPAFLSPDDAHVLFRLNETIVACTDGLERYRFNEVAHALYEFVWHDFCDWYVESAKEPLGGEDVRRRAHVLGVMRHVMCAALRLLHPFMPFLTEELWHALGFGGRDEYIMRAEWPAPLAAERLAALGVDAETVAYVDCKRELIRAARTLRTDYGIAPNRKVRFLIKPVDARTGERLERERNTLASLLRAESLEIDAQLETRKAMPGGVSALGAVFMPIEGLLDVAAELARLGAQRDQVASDLQRTKAKLQNAAFVAKAPREVVERQEARQLELLQKSERLQRVMNTLSET